MLSSIVHSLFHGALRERDFILLLGAGGLALFVGTISAWLGAHFGARLAIRRAFRESIDIPAMVTEARYNELARSIDAIALEVERISEAQRFVAKTLVERTGSVTTPVSVPAPRREPGATTPH